MTSPARRPRWDLLALLLLLMFPTFVFLITAIGRLDVHPQQEALYAELRALAERAPPQLPPDDPRTELLRQAAKGWEALATMPFDDAARADLDSVIAGERAPWQLSRTTLAVIERRDAPAGALLKVSSDCELVHGIPVVPRAAWADLGRHLAFVSIDARSRGRAAAADGICLVGFTVAARWPVGGDLGDILDASALLERLWRPCAEGFSVERDELFDLIDDPVDLELAARRSAAATGIQFHLNVVGGLPADVPALRWTQRGLRADVLERLSLADRWRSESDCVARARQPGPRAAADVCAAFDSERKLAEDALHRRRLQQALIVGRLALEANVADTGRWPVDVAELVAHDDELATLLRDPTTHQPFTLFVHEPYATLMSVGAVAQSVRASRPD